MILSKECYERGCACHDDRVDEGIEIEPQREWVGLTDEEIWNIFCDARLEPEQGWLWNGRAIEQALKEKNYGK